MQESEQMKDTVTVIDDAGVLMEEEADWIQSVAAELSKKTGWSVTAVVCEGDSQLYASVENGIRCIVDTKNSSVSFQANGKAKDYLDSSRIEAITEEAKEPIAEQDYTQSLYLMLLGADKDYDAGEVSHSAVWIVAGAVIICAAAGIFGIVRHKRVR